ncbi:MAG: hypothetical protein ABI565_13325 [Vicinamibacteria bacterium]
MKIQYIESIFIKGVAVDVGDIRDEEHGFALAMIGSGRAVEVKGEKPSREKAPDGTEVAMTTGKETAAVDHTFKARGRG